MTEQIADKPHICLNMIVKNEAHIIRETLESIYKYIDYYVINDTGSTDNTVEVIRDYFNEKNIRGEIHEHEYRTCQCHTGIYKKYKWFHFGWNRSYALKLCEGKSDYIWVIDADDILVGDLKFPVLKEDSYLLTYGSGFTYQRAQIFRNDTNLNWHYVNGKHEYPDCNKKNYSKGFITGDYYIDSRRLGDRSKDPMKYLNDARDIEEELQVNPNDVRNMFYCAQSYFDAGDMNNAIKWYKKRIASGGWYEEIFYSYYKIANASENLGASWKEIERAYLDAYNYCKFRAEPLHNIAKIYNHKKDFQNAYRYGKMAEKISYPEKCILFIFKDVYDYKIKDELAISAYYVGKYHESYSINKKLLESDLVPKEDKKRIETNLKLVVEKLNQKNKKICCIYAGNEILGDSKIIFDLIIELSKYHKILLVGNKINLYQYNDVIIMDVEQFKAIYENKRIDYLVLLNSINYFMCENVKNIKANKTMLLQLDNYIKLISEKGLNICIYNDEYLNKIFENINNIFCIDKKIKNKIQNDYKLLDHSVIFLDKDYNKLIDEDPVVYKFKKLSEEDNGFIYLEPNHIKYLKNNMHDYEFSKQLVTEFYSSLTNEFPSFFEVHYQLAKLLYSLNDNTGALITMDNALKLNSKLNKEQASLILLKAKILTKQEKYLESFNLGNELLKKNSCPLDSKLKMQIEDARDQNIDHVKDSYLYYPKNKINTLTQQFKSDHDKKSKKVMFSMTTCKRYDLFEKTMNSFLNCCLDLNLICHWICVDDNSNEEDRNKMKKLYPFFEFVFKNEDQKGHYISMNIIHGKMQERKADYLLHLEDDWHFIEKRNFVTESIKILSENEKIGQVLFNKNYAEIEPFKKRIMGGTTVKTKDDSMRYLIHEYLEPDTKEYKDFIHKYSGFGTVAYWPHFSFRPSVLKTSVLKDVGLFINTPHFEMQYAKEYIVRNYKSAFFDTFSCIHIGKKTWEQSGKNSYALNEMNQFSINNEKFLSIRVISNNENTDGRNIDVWKEFKTRANDVLPFYVRHVPRNITNLDNFMKKILLNNSFNYVRPILNELMLHLDIMKSNNSKYLVVLKDFVTFRDRFKAKLEETLNCLINSLENSDVEMIVFENENYDNGENIKIIKCNNVFDFDSLGGYIISKAGCDKLLTYLETKQIKNKKELNENIDLQIYTLNQSIIDYKVPERKIINPDKFFKNLDGYKFYSQLDSFGNDIKCCGDLNVEELKKMCDKDETAIGFNTLGWIKNKINPVEDFIFLPMSNDSSQGLYVKIKNNICDNA